MCILVVVQVESVSKGRKKWGAKETPNVSTKANKGWHALSWPHRGKCQHL